MIIQGDALKVLPTLPAGSFDACVTDPPYHLTAGKKGGTGEASVNLDSPAGRSTGFMGKRWDGGDVAFQPAFWREVLRVLKPGAHLVAAGAPRTHHRLMVALEDAGFEIRDCVMHVFGSGFPKSHNGPWGGTALKPAYEPWVLCRKPLAGTVAENFAVHRTGALNIDGCRVGTGGKKWENPRGGIWTADANANARLIDNPLGRWPANLVHDGSEEVIAGFPHSTCGAMLKPYKYTNNGCSFGALAGETRAHHGASSGSAARFFYCAKASQADRMTGNNHPTVKPTNLMRWLCRLITPPGGWILDPFFGSGSTGRGAILEGFRFTGIEREAEYVEIAQARINAAYQEALL